MTPISEIQKKLPEQALNIFKNTFNASDFNKILNSIREERITTFRINTLKSNYSQVLSSAQKLNCKIKQFNLLENTYILEGKINKIMKSELVLEGRIYFQSLASMLPSLILNPLENEKILDIASAPGSKTTHLSALMKNTGTIDAVEPDFIRMERLKYNANILGVKNINFILNKGENFYINSEKKYDKALADTPCSGEGRFNIHDRNSYSNWRLNEIQKLSNLQKKLLKSSILSVKIGGIIVYSTCTLNVYENEEVINSMFEEKIFKIKILEIENKYRNLAESISPFLKFEDKIFNPEIKKALRIIPSKRFEGFFICKIKRIE